VQQNALHVRIKVDLVVPRQEGSVQLYHDKKISMPWNLEKKRKRKEKEKKKKKKEKKMGPDQTSDFRRRLNSRGRIS